MKNRWKVALAFVLVGGGRGLRCVQSEEGGHYGNGAHQCVQVRDLGLGH